MFLSNISDYLSLMYDIDTLKQYRDLLIEFQKKIDIIYFAYLYDIGDEEAYDDYAVMLSELGDGKGVISRHFILKGIHVVSNHYKYQWHMEKKKVSKEKQNALKELCFIEL